MKNKICIFVDLKTIKKIDISIIKRKFRNLSNTFEYALNKLIDKNEAKIK